jgi:CDP-glucose 4,6-dehydratase
MTAMPDRFWRDRPVLVTGATGLLGGRLVHRLVEAGSDVTCVVRDWVPRSELVRSGDIERVRVARGDVRDGPLLERVLAEDAVHTVFHLAAQTIVSIANRNPLSTWETNIGGTWALLEACRRVPGVQEIVVASSDKAYGEADALPYTEDTPLRPQYPYDVSKACADMIAHSYCRTFSLPVAVTRCGNLFGEGDLNWSRIVPGTIRSALRGEPPVIRSDGTPRRDYLYVEDAVAAYLLLAEALHRRSELRGRAFNFSYGQPLSVLEIVEAVLEAADSAVRPSVQGMALAEIRDQYLDSTFARRALGWEPTHGLQEGLRRTIRWYRQFFETAGD